MSKVNEFKELVKRAETEHKETPAALVEEKLDVSITSELAVSVLRSSLKRLEGEISERADGIATELTDNELREFRGILDLKIPTPGKKYIEIARGKCPDFRECIK